MSKLFLAFLITVTIFSCKTDKKENYKEKESDNLERANENEILDGKLSGFKLMEQKCYACHVEKPSQSKNANKLAPPMLRIQEHYLPAYPERDEFVSAVIDFLNNPSKEKTLMPGANRKYDLKKKEGYKESELRLIAEALYDKDFGNFPKKKMNQFLQLNEEKKWKLKPASIRDMQKIQNKINRFNSSDIALYNQFGKDVFDATKMILLDEAYKGDVYNQIHIFFSGIKENMHILMATKSMGEAKNQVMVLKIKFNEFRKFFK